MNSHSIDIVLKNFADSAAVNFHQFSKRCLSTMNLIIDNQKKRISQRRIRIQEDCRRKIRIQTSQQPPQPVSQPTHPAEETNQSRLARINRIKENLQAKKGEDDSRKWTQQQLDIALEQFSKDLRPQILAKYPSAPADKVQKVILQKWGTIDPLKKDAYVAKIVARNKPAHQDSSAQPQQAQQSHEGEGLAEVKREEMPPQSTPAEEQPYNRFGAYLETVKNREGNEAEMVDQRERERASEKVQNMVEDMTPEEGQSGVLKQQKEQVQSEKPGSRENDQKTPQE